MTSKTFIWYDGEYWKFKHETVNAFQFQNENGNTRIFVRWQVVKGLKDYQQKWPNNKLKD